MKKIFFVVLVFTISGPGLIAAPESLNSLESLTRPNYIEPTAVGIANHRPEARRKIEAFLAGLSSEELLSIFRSSKRPEVRVYTVEELGRRGVNLLPLIIDYFSDERVVYEGIGGCTGFLPQRTTVRKLLLSTAFLSQLNMKRQYRSRSDWYILKKLRILDAWGLPVSFLPLASFIPDKNSTSIAFYLISALICFSIIFILKISWKKIGS